MTALNNGLGTSRNIDNYEATKIAVNADVELEGRAQPVEKGIIGCAFVLSNFCMGDKLVNQSTENL